MGSNTTTSNNNNNNNDISLSLHRLLPLFSNKQQDTNPASPTMMFIDNLSPLLDTFGVSSVVCFLSSLRHPPGNSNSSNTSNSTTATSVLFVAHRDLHSEDDVRMVSYGASCVVDFVPASERVDPPQPHGCLDIKCRRRHRAVGGVGVGGGGTIKTERVDYRIESSGAITTLGPPLTRMKPSKLPGGTTTNVVTATSVTVTALPTEMMRLEVSEKEAEARSKVALPYEHQGQGQLYAAGTDFRDYLPEAAGGRKADSGRLGHILYVRDSDSEEPDSDEDPDDDLDI